MILVQYVFKPLGAILVMACCFLASFSISSRAKKEIAELEAFILLIGRIRTDIACFSRPLCEIYAGFEADVFEKSGFIKTLKEKGLSCAIEITEHKFSLCEENMAIIKQFASTIGKSYKEEEIKTCDYYISQLSERHKVLKDSFPKRNKLSRSLCFLLGVSIIIILV